MFQYCWLLKFYWPSNIGQYCTFEHPVFSNVGPTYEELTQFVIVLLENLLSFIKDSAT